MEKRILLPKLFLPVLLCCITTLLAAQNNYTRVAAGLNYQWPKLSKDFNSGPWKGAHIRSKFLEMGYVAGKPTDLTGAQKLGFHAYLGVNLPFRKLAFGKREYGIKGIYVVPFLGADIGYMGIGGKKSAGITIAPGVSVQLPYTLVDFRLNTTIGFNNVPGLVRYKVLFAPAIIFQLDALWDVMDPELTFDAHYEGVNRYIDVTETSTHIITTTTYVPYNYDVYRYDVGPHISLGPRICYWNLKKGNETFMAGIVQSGRAHGFGYDLIAEKGTITSQEGYQVKASRVMGRLSADLNFSTSGLTQFTRLMIGGGIGYNFFNTTDTHLHTENGEFFNLFISFELGAVSISYEVNKAFYNRFDDQKYFALTYRVPIERVWQRYRELKASR